MLTAPQNEIIDGIMQPSPLQAEQNARYDARLVERARERLSAVPDIARGGHRSGYSEAMETPGTRAEAWLYGR